jgi:hypothetical protein
VKFDVYATRTENVDALMIQRDTFGRSHSITMDGGVLIITLPSFPAEHGCKESLADDPENPDDTWFGVGHVALKAEIASAVNFRGRDDDFNSPTIHRCASSERAMKAAQSILDDGFDLWKRTLRWTGNAPNIGIDEIETAYSLTIGRGYKMFRQGDDALFSNFGGGLSSHAAGKISREAWKSASDAFEANEAPPVWFDYLHESFRLKTVGNFRAAVIYSAIAAETVMRAAFDATLPGVQSQTAKRILERTPIQGLLSSFHDILNISKVEFEKCGKNAVRGLFRMRNKIMHQGLKENMPLADIKQLHPAISTFVIQTDEFINQTVGLPQRVFPARSHLD